MTDIYLWKDFNDPDQFLLGVKTSAGRYYSWAMIFVDGMIDLFPAIDLKKVSVTPVKIELGGLIREEMKPLIDDIVINQGDENEKSIFRWDM